MLEKSRKKFKKGITLYLTIVILSLLFAIGIGLSVIVFTQIRIAREVGYSVNALCAADSGVERALYELYTTTSVPNTFTISETFYNASFTADFYASSTLQCFPSTQYYCIKSTGEYKGVLRKVDASF